MNQRVCEDESMGKEYGVRRRKCNSCVGKVGDKSAIEITKTQERSDGFDGFKQRPSHDGR